MRCSEVSMTLEEPLLATAPVAERWELVERPKPWGREHGITRPRAKVLLVKRVGDAPAREGRKYLVCTNGARDPCCAIRGAAVADALAVARPGAAYESSHLGGHRFAANLLVLPDGLCFGRLDVRSALAVLEELETGTSPARTLPRAVVADGGAAGGGDPPPAGTEPVRLGRPPNRRPS